MFFFCEINTWFEISIFFILGTTTIHKFFNGSTLNDRNLNMDVTKRFFSFHKKAHDISLSQKCCFFYRLLTFLVNVLNLTLLELNIFRWSTISQQQCIIIILMVSWWSGYLGLWCIAYAVPWGEVTSAHVHSASTAGLKLKIFFTTCMRFSWSEFPTVMLEIKLSH